MLLPSLVVTPVGTPRSIKVQFYDVRAAHREPLDGTARSIWQCLGMVIGVYGIGYLAASMDPLRHWPIVLVGLLGKVFGPIGFVWCATRGEIPWAFGTTIPTNDLLWWIPFALILRASWREAVSEPVTPPATVGAALHQIGRAHV